PLGLVPLLCLGPREQHVPATNSSSLALAFAGLLGRQKFGAQPQKRGRDSPRPLVPRLRVPLALVHAWEHTKTLPYGNRRNREQGRIRTGPAHERSPRAPVHRACPAEALLHEPVLDREQRGSRTVRHTALREDIRQVVLNRPRRDSQALGDLLVGQPPG